MQNTNSTKSQTQSDPFPYSGVSSMTNLKGLFGSKIERETFFAFTSEPFTSLNITLNNNFSNKSSWRPMNHSKRLKTTILFCTFLKLIEFITLIRSISMLLSTSNYTDPTELNRNSQIACQPIPRVLLSYSQISKTRSIELPTFWNTKTASSTLLSSFSVIGQNIFLCP